MSDTQANWNADQAIEKLCATLNSTNYTLYLTGDNNFRYKVFPEYKIGRRNTPRPEHLQSVKEYLVKEYGAVLSDGCEADDLCGIDQCTAISNGEDTRISHIDKDIDMIPGLHHSPAIIRLGEVVRPERFYTVSPTEAIRFFYYQMLVGDSTDGIKGAKGIGKVNAVCILADLTEEEDLFNAVEAHYSCEEEMLLNGKLLWIMREKDKQWEIPSFD